MVGNRITRQEEIVGLNNRFSRPTEPDAEQHVARAEEELERYKYPPSFDHIGDPVPQPAASTGRPEYTNMDEAFAAAFDMPDDDVTRELSESTPPVKVA